MRLVAALAVVLLAACAGPPPGDIEPPRVHLADVRLGRPGLLEQRLLVDLRLVNPNDADLPLDGLTFALAVNGEPLAEGVSDARTTLPRLGEATVTVAATAAMLDVLARIMGLAGRERLTYRISGRAFLAGPGRRAVDYERRGELRLAPTPSDERRHLRPIAARI